MKPAIVIDFDGTLCLDRFWRSLPPDALAKVRVFEPIPDSLSQRWLRGEYTAEEINQIVAEQIGWEYERLWELFVTDCQQVHVPPSVLAQIAALRRSYHLVLLTDNMDSFDRFTVPALHLTDYFDVVQNSYSLGRSKVDEEGRTFLEIIDRLQSSPTDALLLDNSWDSCSVFEGLGGAALQVTREFPLSYWLKKIPNPNPSP